MAITKDDLRRVVVQIEDPDEDLYLFAWRKTPKEEWSAGISGLYLDDGQYLNTDAIPEDLMEFVTIDGDCFYNIDAVVASEVLDADEIAEKAINSRADVIALFVGFLKGGINFHPDTRGNEYVNSSGERTFGAFGEALYEATTERCFVVGTRDGFDVYEAAVEAARCMCEGCDAHGYDDRCDDSVVTRIWSLEERGLIFLVCSDCARGCVTDGNGQWAPTQEYHDEAWRILEVN